MYAIVDIETTGGFAQNHSITEIAIAIHNGEKVTDWYETLINPGIPIPTHITALTGITNEMVENAPTFNQVASKIYQLLQPHIFVAHNVNFDYSFVRQQLAQAGFDWNAKKLCTVRLSRKIFPNFPSYSLGNLCTQLGIVQTVKHRAGADTQATAEVFTLLLQNDKEKAIPAALKNNAGEFRLPAHLDVQEYNRLPMTTGVYYFLNTKNEIIYVGKANNIKKRVSQHFSGKITQETRQHFLKEIAHISHQECGNDLVALLLEEQEIKKHWPQYNRAQKKIKFAWGLFDYTDRKGHIRLGIDYIRKNNKPIMRFASLAEARHFLLQKTDEFVLCPKLCAIDTSDSSSCNPTFTKHCTGNCREKNQLKEYNQRAQKFINSLENHKPTYALLGKGRTLSEQTIVYVDEGIFKGFGFIDKETVWNTKSDIENYIQPSKYNIDAELIINAYLRRNPFTKTVVFS